ncbi:MAG: protein translocase subunit SecF [Patescibacteria group bacterium]|nr:protein translocase subunit SecF [Patescibacteria group bacterium]
MRLPIIKYRNAWFAFSSLLVVLSVVALWVYPLRFGIDFTGGSSMELAFSNRPAVTEIQSLLAEKNYQDNIVQPVGDNGLILRLKHMDEPAHQALLTDIKAKWTDAQEMQFQTVGPTVGDELRKKAIWSLTLVLLGICSYIAFAFRKVSKPVASWKYGIITLIPAIAHDVMLPVAVIAVVGHFLAVDVNSAFIAAILTVLGFSVHDTIVVFDRIRENLLKTAGAFEDIVERSVNETIARSINTSLTVFFPLFATFLWGGESIKWFALTLIIGLIAGTYSSIFLCAPLLVVFQKKSGR